jgi:hypothetical protein
MRYQNLSAVLSLFLVFNFSSVVNGSKRNFNSRLGSIPDKKLNDDFKDKMDDFFSPEAMSMMMRILANNNKHRVANGNAPTRYVAGGSSSAVSSQQQMPSGDPLAELEASLFGGSSSSGGSKSNKPTSAAQFFKPRSHSNNNNNGHQQNSAYLAQQQQQQTAVQASQYVAPVAQNDNYHQNKNYNSNNNDDSINHLFHRFG